MDNSGSDFISSRKRSPGISSTMESSSVTALVALGTDTIHDDAAMNAPGHRRPMILSRQSSSVQISFTAPLRIKHISGDSSPCIHNCVPAGHHRTFPNLPCIDAAAEAAIGPPRGVQKPPMLAAMTPKMFLYPIRDFV